MPFDEEELDPHGECAAEIKRLGDVIGRAIINLPPALRQSDPSPGITTMRKVLEDYAKSDIYGARAREVLGLVDGQYGKSSPTERGL